MGFVINLGHGGESCQDIMGAREIMFTQPAAAVRLRPLAVDPLKIRDIQVLETIKDGQSTYAIEG